MSLHAILSRGTAVVLLGMLHVGNGWSANPDYELGEYLAGECTSCHRADSVNEGIPNIFGIPRAVFVEVMTQYRNGLRSNQTMRNVAQSLNQEETAALGAYLEQSSSTR